MKIISVIIVTIITAALAGCTNTPTDVTTAVVCSGREGSGPSTKDFMVGLVRINVPEFVAGSDIRTVTVDYGDGGRLHCSVRAEDNR